ncbi:hypothetical protein HDU80_006836 [Chytriomyces hyalinus]|nr:hypothetical protein HDU80_006836 [Chytriomyces hyalinus]
MLFRSLTTSRVLLSLHTTQQQHLPRTTYHRISATPLLQHSRFASSAPPPPPGFNPKTAAAAHKIFATIQSDPQLTALCTQLSIKLSERGIIDIKNPTKQPSMKDLLKIATDREITGLLTEVLTKLKATGVLEDEAVKSSMGGAGAAGGLGFMGALFGGSNSNSNSNISGAQSTTPKTPAENAKKSEIEDAEFVDVDAKKPDTKNAGIASKLKGIFKK